MNTSIVHLKDMISNHIVTNPNGLNHVLEWTINALMKVEQLDFLIDQPTGTNKANGYRTTKGYGSGKLLELRVPRDRNGQFYPKIMALLRNQEAEIDRAVSSLYAEGLTQSQIGRVFENLYGNHYSQASISRMTSWMHDQVRQWRERSLQAHYPVLFIDAVHIKVRRDQVRTEAFYVVLAIKDDHTREVLAIESMPEESAFGWAELLEKLKKRGVEQVGLIVADGLTGLSGAVGRVFPQTSFQRCITHIKRSLLNRVNSDHKKELGPDLANVFRTDDPFWTPEKAKEVWVEVCKKWGKHYSYFSRLVHDIEYEHAFTYLNYDYRVRSMLYTTNWLERLNRDFRRVTRMRASMPGDESVITLLGYVAMDKTAYQRRVPKLEYDSLFKKKF